jgi:hypothetical protein
MSNSNIEQYAPLTGFRTQFDIEMQRKWGGVCQPNIGPGGQNKPNIGPGGQNKPNIGPGGQNRPPSGGFFEAKPPLQYHQSKHSSGPLSEESSY